MHTIHQILITAGLVLLSNAVIATTHATTQCTQDGLTRTVSVVYSNPGEQLPCEVFYEKSSTGQSMTLWRAQNELGYCEARAAEFINKLTDLGWQCETTNAEISDEIDSDLQADQG